MKKISKVCEDWFEMGSYFNQRSAGFYMNDQLKQTIDLWVKNVKNDWDFVIIISGQGTVRVGKSLEGSEKIKVIENGEVVSKKISEFSDGENVKTISWDFKNKKEVVTDSEVIVEDEEKEYYEVELENGKKVVCTMEHNLFVRRRFCGTNDKMTYNIIETKLKNLKEGDELVCLN